MPAMVAPVRMPQHEHAPRREYSIAQHHDEYEPHRAHHQPHRTGSVPSMPYSSPPLSQEKDNRGYAAHADRVGHVEHHHHDLHRTSTAPALGHDAYARELRNVAYGGDSGAGNYRAEHPYRYPSPATHGHEHGLHRAGSHMMAPPIRLQSSDYVPPKYERYTHAPSTEPARHRHHYEESDQRYVGEYAQERSYVADRRAPRGVYA
jgi:hypothetical protein